MTDRFRRDDLRPAAAVKAKRRKPRIMFAVVHGGRDRGAYRTRAEAEAAAAALDPDAYVTECLRSPR